MKKSKGFAVVFVLVFIAAIITIIGNIIYQTQIVAKYTMFESDSIKAQGSAQTGLSFAKILIKFHKMTQSKDAQNFPFELPSNLYASLNDIPIGGNVIKSNPLISKYIDQSLVNELQKIPGQFVLNVSSENCKLDINLIQPGPYSISTNFALKNIFSTSDGKALLDIYHLNGEDLVRNLVEYLRKANRPLITLDEMRLIDGFQYDDIYDIYSPYFTVWPTLDNAQSAPLNPNCAPIELMASLLRPNQIADINPVLWQKFNEFRKKNTFKSAADLNKWFEENAKTWLTDDTKNMISRYFGYKENIFRIEVFGIVRTTKQKLVEVIQVDDNGQMKTLYSQWGQ